MVLGRGALGRVGRGVRGSGVGLGRGGPDLDSVRQELRAVRRGE